MLRERAIHLGLLMILSLFLFGFQLDEQDFWGRHGESRRAEVSREMVASGDWIVPHLNGEPLVTKPPLYYWATAGMFVLTGNIDEISARIPSIISGLLGVLVTYFWAAALFSPRVGLFSGIILATSFLYAGMARSAEVDMLLTLFTTSALCCFTFGYQQRKPTPTFWYLASALCIGLGTLTKNPIGIAVPLVTIAGFILLTRDFQLILKAKPWWGLLVFLLILFPWFVLAYQRVPHFFDVLRQETVGRYIDPEGTPHKEPFYYYFYAIGAFAPWIAFLPGAIAALIAKRARLTASHYLMIAASVMTFLLFSSVGSKREYYLLPMYPFLAILTAGYLDEYVAMKQMFAKRWTWLGADIPIVAFAGVLCLVGVSSPVVANIYLPTDFLRGIAFGAIFLITGIVMLLRFWRRKPAGMFWLYIVALLSVYLFVFTAILPEMNRYRSRKAFFHEVANVVGAADLFDFNYEGFDLPFYTQRIVPVVRSAGDLEKLLLTTPPQYVVTAGEYYVKLQKEHSEIAARFQVALERTWTSAMDPKRQRQLLLLKVGE